MRADQALSAGPGPAVLAIDVGGTDLKIATLNEDGQLGPIQRSATPTSTSDPGGAIVTAIADLVAGADVAAVGVTIPGHVDEVAGVGVRSTNLGWRNFPFRERLTQATGLPTSISHDVRAAGEAEYRLGAAQGRENVAFVAIGTGIAAALRLDGRTLSRGGLAGELGHTVVDPNGPHCRCGRTGCLEAISSAGAIVRRYQEHSGLHATGAAQVLQRADDGDPIATQIWTQALDGLITAVSILSSLLAPELVVLGGGLSEAGDALLRPLRRGLTERVGTGYLPALAQADLGQDAGTWGAALAARDLLMKG